MRIGSLFLLAIAAAVTPGRPVSAQPPAAPARESHPSFGRGTQRVSLAAGYGVGFGAAGSQGKDAADVRTAAIVPSWGIGISGVQGEGHWYRGSWEALVEGQFLIEAEPRTGWGGGGALGFRYNFLGGRPLVPFMGIALGLGAIDFDLRSQADGFNFFLAGGAGAHWFLTDHLALTAEARYHHISNAQTKSRNSGINTVLFLLGTTFFFE